VVVLTQDVDAEEVVTMAAGSSCAHAEWHCGGSMARC
jgi:hypothetical protein